MGIDNDVSRAGVEARRFDARDRPPFGKAGDVLGDVGPSLAAVRRDVDQAVVAAGPEHALADRRLGECEDRAVILGGGVVASDGTAGPFLLALVVAGQVGADGLPALALVGR